MKQIILYGPSPNTPIGSPLVDKPWYAWKKTKENFDECYDKFNLIDSNLLLYSSHISNGNVHVTSTDKVNWNNKVDKASGYSLMSDAEHTKLASMQDRFKGIFPSIEALESVYPISTAGSYAQVGTSSNSSLDLYLWDDINQQWSLYDGSALVLSVNDRIGPVVLTKADVGLENVPNIDTTNPDNIIQTTSKQFTSQTEKDIWNGKQASLGYTPEDVSNKVNDLLDYIPDHSDNFYPSAFAVKLALEASILGLYNDRGNWNPVLHVYPAGGGSGPAGDVAKGDVWTISADGTINSLDVLIGYTIRALIDDPGQDDINWAITQVGLGYVPENRENKSIDSTMGGTNPSDNLYPSQKAVNEFVNNKLLGATSQFTETLSNITLGVNDTLIVHGITASPTSVDFMIDGNPEMFNWRIDSSSPLSRIIVDNQGDERTGVEITITYKNTSFLSATTETKDSIEAKLLVTELLTTDKTIVGAINELYNQLNP